MKNTSRNQIFKHFETFQFIFPLLPPHLNYTRNLISHQTKSLIVVPTRNILPPSNYKTPIIHYNLLRHRPNPLFRILASQNVSNVCSLSFNRVREQFLISKILSCWRRGVLSKREGRKEGRKDGRTMENRRAVGVTAAENCNALRSVSSQHELIGIQRGTFIFASRAKRCSENNSRDWRACSRSPSEVAVIFFFFFSPPLATSKTAIDRERACNR